MPKIRAVESVYVRFGHDLQRLRRQRKLSQGDLARLVDPSGDRLSRSSVANIENAKQRVALHLFLAFAKALKVDPKDLLPDQLAEVPNIVERAPNLTQPEQDWLTRIVADPPRRRAAKAKARGA
jgi:transcriptional regulator with XRE-family HTH domain